MVPSHLPHLGHPAHLKDLATVLHRIPWPLLHPEVVAPPQEEQVVLAEVGLEYRYARPLLHTLRLQVVVYAGLQDTQHLRSGPAGVDPRQGVVPQKSLQPRIQLLGVASLDRVAGLRSLMRRIWGGLGC
eukprot:maker-scaffold718_size107075-snap-gene-0.21 protein:Tk08774 transcript:maker-scaffold718_size107075-snap-gene-0.21-mRNA-1 annotation:"---NA---"